MPTKRDVVWGLSGLILGLGMSLSAGWHYSLVSPGEGYMVFKLDRWTGALERCAAECLPVRKGDPTGGFRPVLPAQR